MVEITAPSTNTLLGFGVLNRPSAVNNIIQFNNSTQQFEFVAVLDNPIGAQLSDSTNQRPVVTTPVEITFDTNDQLDGITHSESVDPADITIVTAGRYIIFAAPQVGRTSGNMDRDFDLWFRVNDVDVPNTNVRIVLDRTAAKDVIISQLYRTFAAGDKINVLMSISATGEGIGIEAISPAGEPLIPSIIYTMHRVT